MTEGVAAKLVTARCRVKFVLRRNVNKVDFSIEMEKFEQLRYVELKLFFDETLIGIIFHIDVENFEQLRYVELNLYFDETQRGIFFHIDVEKFEQLRYNLF